MLAEEHWEWTRQELRRLSSKNLIRQPILINEFEPGDFAYVTDSLNAIFTDFLKSKEYRLTPSEDVLTPTKGRYCIVLQRISLDKYIVCCCISFGGARGFHDLTDPVARHFGVPLNENTKWPGLAPLRTQPLWKSEYGAFVLAIPVIRDGLTTSNLKDRVRLAFPDLHRLKRIIRDRSQSFDKHSEQIRAGFLVSQMRAAQGPRGPKVVRSPLMKESHAPRNQPTYTQRDGRRSFNHPVKVNSPDNPQDLTWILEKMRRRVFDRSIYLNSQSPPKRPFLTTLPKAHFVPTLRTSLATITRLI